MKKIYYLLTGLIAILLCTNSVNAMIINEDGNYVNDNGVIMTSEQYNMLLEKIGKISVEHINQKMFESFIYSNKNIESQKHSYITTYKYNKYGHIINVETIETSEEEALSVKENANLHVINGKLQDISRGLSLMGVIDGSYYETDSKTIYFNYYVYKPQGSSEEYTIQYSLEWLKVPIVKSFDVLGFRWDGSVSKSNITSFAVTQYTNAGNQDYSLDGTNTKFFSNGLGISMNLFDDATRYQIEANIISNKKFGEKMWASYQHAVNNISLATSQNYSINSSGLGGVLDFHNGYSKYFDDMNGLLVTL